MYKILEVDDKIRVSPAKFNMPLEEAIKNSLEEKLEGTTDRSTGIVLSVVSIRNVGEGRIFPGDGAIHYPVRFEVLTYIPEMYEIIKGNVIDVTEFGVFVRFGPVDGMIHVSQIMDDFVSYDPKNMVFNGRDSKRILKEGDVVRSRIISVSMGSDKQYKIGLTTRQPGLGVIDWLSKDKKEKSEPKVEKVEKKAEPAKKAAKK